MEVPDGKAAEVPGLNGLGAKVGVPGSVFSTVRVNIGVGIKDIVPHLLCSWGLWIAGVLKEVVNLSSNDVELLNGTEVERGFNSSCREKLCFKLLALGYLEGSCHRLTYLLEGIVA